MNSFVIRTSTADKQNIDKQIIKAIFAPCIENVQVKKAIKLLRPASTSACPKTVATVDEIYAEKKMFCLRSGHSVNTVIKI